MAAALSPWLWSGIFLILLTAALGIAYAWMNPPPQALTPPEARAAIHAQRFHRIIDVRSDAEWDAGNYPGAVHILPHELEWALPHDRAAGLLFYCHSGRRAAAAAADAQDLGYRNVSYLIDGDYQSLEARHHYVEN